MKGEGGTPISLAATEFEMKSLSPLLALGKKEKPDYRPFFLPSFYKDVTKNVLSYLGAFSRRTWQNCEVINECVSSMRQLWKSVLHYLINNRKEASADISTGVFAHISLPRPLKQSSPGVLPPWLTVSWLPVLLLSKLYPKYYLLVSK